ncbi:hypothetical protein EON67_05395, partial [archaeon]
MLRERGRWCVCSHPCACVFYSRACANVVFHLVRAQSSMLMYNAIETEEHLVDSLIKHVNVYALNREQRSANVRVPKVCSAPNQPITYEYYLCTRIVQDGEPGEQPRV